jgi:hypothetical protein
MIKGIIDYQKSYKDQHLREELKDKPEKLLTLVEAFFHCG